MPPAPYRFEDNPYTLLDKSDLVLVDAIGTGFSRAGDAEMFKKFWGVTGRHRGLQRVHPPLHHAQRTLEFATLSVRRELWHHALGGHCRIPCRQGHFLQWHHAAFHGAELRDPDQQQDQRPGLRVSCPLVHHDRGLPSQAGARSCPGHEQGARRIAALGLHRLRAGAGQGRRPDAGRTPEDRQSTGALHRLEPGYRRSGEPTD